MGLFKKKQKKQKPVMVSAIVPAAGSSTRMNGTDKLFAEVNGIPVIVHTLAALENCALISEIIIAARSEVIAQLAELCKKHSITKVTKIIRGGDTRTASVLAALMEISPEAKVAAIHDGARPCVCERVLEETISEALKSGAAAPAVPLVDTIKEADENGMVVQTIDRKKFCAIQTPQCFEPGLIKGALTKAIQKKWDITDDCSAVERMGMSVKLVPGDRQNIKVTAKEDLYLVSAILNDR